MNNTPNTEHNRSSAPADEWKELLETPEVMSSSGSPSSRDIPTPADYPWEIDSSSSSSSSSSSQKLMLILREDDSSNTADQSDTNYEWTWRITDNEGHSTSGNEGSFPAKYVGKHVDTMPGISDRVGDKAGQEVTFVFVSRDKNGVWKPNGWSVTARKYEVTGASDSEIVGLNNYDLIPPEAKPVTRETMCGMTTFLTKKLEGAKDPAYEHWYMFRP